MIGQKGTLHLTPFHLCNNPEGAVWLYIKSSFLISSQYLYTGKTTLLIIGLSPTGAYPSGFVCKATGVKYPELCSSSYSTYLYELAIDIFNVAQLATMKHESRIPTSMAMVSANFTTLE